MRSALFFLLGLLALASPLRAQLLSGTLMEAESRAILPGGVVTLLDRDSAVVAQLRTDSAGAFSFTLAKHGSYRLRGEQPGYRTAVSPELALGVQDTLEVEFSLARNEVVLEPLVVRARNRRLTAAARLFYQRAEAGGFGTFITREDIEKAHPARTTDLFHRIPGVRMTEMMGGSDVTIRGGCRPTLYVDGIRVDGYRSIDDLVQPLDVEGLEVYRSAHTAPAEYTGLLAGCAVVLVWTRIE